MTRPAVELTAQAARGAHADPTEIRVGDLDALAIRQCLLERFDDLGPGNFELDTAGRPVLDCLRVSGEHSPRDTAAGPARGGRDEHPMPTSLDRGLR